MATPSTAASPDALPEPALSRALDAVLLPINDETRNFLGFDEDTSGALVLAVAQGGISEVYGIRPGDIVVSVSDVPFAMPDEIDPIVWAFINSKTFDFTWTVARESGPTSIAFPLVLSHFQESYLVSDVPGWPSWSGWSSHSSRSFGEYVAPYLDVFRENFEGPPVCRSCGVPAAAAPVVAEAEAAPAATASAPPVSETVAPAIEIPAPAAADAPVAELPAPAVAEIPAVPAEPTTTPEEPAAAPAVLATAPLPLDPASEVVLPLATEAPADVSLADPALAPLAEDPATPAVSAESTPVEDAQVEPARLPRPAPPRPAMQAIEEIPAVPEAEAPIAVVGEAEVIEAPPVAVVEPVTLDIEADQAIGAPADTPAAGVEYYVFDEGGFDDGQPEPQASASEDFCSRYPATCRLREAGYGAGSGSGEGGDSAGGGGGGGGDSD